MKQEKTPAQISVWNQPSHSNYTYCEGVKLPIDLNMFACLPAK